MYRDAIDEEAGSPPLFNPCEYFLFGKPVEDLRGKSFYDMEAVKGTLQLAQNSIKTNFC